MKRQERILLASDLLQKGLSQRFVSRTVHLRHGTVSELQKGAHVTASPRGRPAKVSADVRAFIDMTLSDDASVSDSRMVELVRDKFHVTVGRTTVGRIRRQLRFFWRPPKVIQALTDEQKDERIEFCSWVLANQEQIPNLIFSDESRFELGPDNAWRRIKRGVLNRNCFAERNKFSRGVMVWGAIGPGYKSPLIRCSGGVDSAEYIAILSQSRMVPDLNARFGPTKWTFVQDGAPCHQSREVMTWLESTGVAVAPGWPPNSPDLNPIEMVWAVVKRALRAKPYDGRDLFDSVKEVWDALSQDSLDRLVNTFHRRCEQVLDVAGGSITPYLSGHRSPPTREVPPPLVWTPEDDEALARHYRRLGSKWTIIGNLLGKRPNGVKNRWRRLQQIRCNEQLRAEQPAPIPPIGLFPGVDDMDTTDFDDLITIR